MTTYKPPSLASYIAVFGWLSFVAAFFSFLSEMMNAGESGSAGSFWYAWELAAAWCVVGLLLLAVAKSLHYLGLIAHHLDAAPVGGVPSGNTGAKQSPGSPAFVNRR